MRILIHLMLALPPLVALSVAPLLCQTPGSGTVFEVASVRRSPPDSSDFQRLWGQGSGRVVLRRASLRFLIREAYGLHDYQISGPDWLKVELYDILASAPAGTPGPQILQMLRSLIQERFQMTFHRETEEAPIYALTVRPGGPMLKEISNDPATDSSAEPYATMAVDAAGKLAIKINDHVLGVYRMTTRTTSFHYEFEAMTMAGLERFLNQNSLDRPVLNRTGLSGTYAVTIDVPLSVGGNTDPTGYSVEESLRKHGLQLTRQRGTVERFVIDRISKDPAEN